MNDAFDRLIDLKRMGRSAHEAVRIALSEGHSRIHLIRAVREVFCVEVFEAKGTLVQPKNGSLAEQASLAAAVEEALRIEDE